MNSHTGNRLSSMGKLRSILLVYIFLIIALGGCSTVVKMSYSPAYIEKRSLVESDISNGKPISVLLLPFKDKREQNEDPFLIYKGISLEKQTLSEYLYHALFKDLKMIGFNVLQGSDKDLSFKEVEFGKKSVNDNIKFVLSVEVHECIPDYEMNFVTVQPYSTFNFHVMIWDNTKSKMVYNERIFKKIMGVETASSSFKNMVNTLLNEDLTIVNVDIAEILASFKGS